MAGPESEHPDFNITVKENPARRLRDLMKTANYREPAEFFIKALDVFEEALKPGAGGKIIVDNPKAGKRFTFDIRNEK